MAKIVTPCLVIVAGCMAVISAQAESRTAVLLDDDWQFYPIPGFSLWPSQAQLKPAQIAQLKCPPPGTGWQTVHLPDDYAVKGDISRQANESLRAGGAVGRLGGREFEVPTPGSPPPSDGKPGALNRPGRDAYAGHGYLPVYPAWYRRQFTIPASNKDKIVSLDFGGVYRDAIVFVNGQFLAQHPSGYSGFQVDITPAVKFGATNDVAVFVDPRWFEGWWYEGAGIYRHVRLVTTDRLHIATWGTFVDATVIGPIARDPRGGDQGNARLTIGTTIRNDSSAARRFTLVSVVTDEAGKEVGSASAAEEVAADSEITFQQEVTIPDALLWSLERPNLYCLKTAVQIGEAEIDRDETSFGIRTLRFEPNEGFFLNGRRVEIKGTCNHHDFPAVGIAAPDNLWSWRVTKLKQMGANAYRCAHNPASEAFYEAADRMGMLVMDETRHLGDTYFPKSNDQTPFTDLSDVKAMVLQHRNHPSIIMWSLANEEGVGPKPHGAKIFAATKAAVKALDPTRPTTGAVNGGYTKRGYISVEDILGMNYHNVEFDRNHQTFPGLTIFGSEDVNAKTSRGSMETSRETARCSQYGDGTEPGSLGAQPWQSWAPVAERPYIAGEFIWTGFDYRGEPNPFSWPAVTSQTGAMDLCGFPKPVYYYWQAVWKEEPSVYVVPDWSFPESTAGKTIRVRAFSNCQRVELSLNGKSLGAQPMPRNGYLEWSVPYERGKLTATAYNGSAVAARCANATAGPPVAVKLKAEVDRLDADGDSVAPIRAEVVDAQGRIVPNADCPISFSVSGAGTIAGTANGDPASHESNVAARRTSFHGLCLVVVRAANRPGTITVEASASGLKQAKTEITCR
jgi:beta-galactosidase